MDKQTYSAQTSISINSPVERVWQALASPELVQQYLHGTMMHADWHEGGTITWRGDWHGTPYEDKGVILRFEPLRVISTSHWSPLSGMEDKPENYHVVTYELAEHDNQTTLTLTQSSSPTQQDADSLIENGWKPVLQALKQLVEGPQE